ncbi:MAG: 2-phospho-L-lactate transferase CofD family protein, partial [Candidatus Helarchaeota archaeon]
MLAGGVGAAKFISGLVREIDSEDLCLIINTGDDITLFGLEISPDLDIIMYTLAGIVNPITGWGVNDDSTNCLEMLRRYKEETWFLLGDKDIATHLIRTKMLREGYTLTEITHHLCNTLGIKARLYPMTDQKVPTQIRTSDGVIHFEEYMIKNRAEDPVHEIIYKDIESSNPPKGLLSIIEKAEGFIICPSNPLVSIGPILSVP